MGRSVPYIAYAGLGPRLRQAMANVIDSPSPIRPDGFDDDGAAYQDSGAKGRPKFAARTIKVLQEMLARAERFHYFTALAHVINAFDQRAEHVNRSGAFHGRPLSYLDGLFDQPGHAAAYRAWLERHGEDCPSVQLTIAKAKTDGDKAYHALAIAYRDEPYQRGLGSLPLLAALHELLLETIGYDAIAEQLDRLRTAPLRAQQAQHMGNELHRQFREFEREDWRRHAADAPGGATPTFYQRHLPLIHRFLAQHAQAGREQRDELVVDDALIFAFWQEQATAKTDGFQLFSSAAEAVFAYLRAQEAEAMQSDIAMAHRYGTDREAQERDVGATAADGPAGDWVSPFVALREPPMSAVNFIIQVQQRQLTWLANLGPLAAAFPLTVLRAVVFGAQQNQHAMARGKRTALDPWQRDYRGYTEAVRAILAKLDDTILASCYVLQQALGAVPREMRGAALAERPDCRLLATLDPRMQPLAAQAYARQKGAGFTPMPTIEPALAVRRGERAPSETVLASRHVWQTVLGGVPYLIEADDVGDDVRCDVLEPLEGDDLRRARQAAQRIDRRGFLVDPIDVLAAQDVLAGHMEGLPALVQLRRLVAHWLDEAPNVVQRENDGRDWLDMFPLDAARFATIFPSVSDGEAR